VEPWDALDSIFEDRHRERERTEALRQVLRAPPTDGTLVLVTHGANIVALTGVSPAPAEFLVLTAEGDGRFRVAGRVTPAALP
jgi:broad specificity phosphatase PhoE